MGERSEVLERIVEVLRARMPDLRRRYGVLKLEVFGSYARGEEGGGSDLDILVEFDDRPLTLLQFVALENELSDLLGIKVDLVEKRSLKPAIGKIALGSVIEV